MKKLGAVAFDQIAKLARQIVNAVRFDLGLGALGGGALLLTHQRRNLLDGVLTQMLPRRPRIFKRLHPQIFDRRLGWRFIFTFILRPKHAFIMARDGLRFGYIYS